MNDSLKWGTKAPIKYNDKKYGLVDIVAYGNFSYQVLNQEILINNQLSEPTVQYMQDCILNSFSMMLSSKAGHDIAMLQNLIDKNEILNNVNSVLINSGLKIIDISILSINLTEESQRKIRDLNSSIINQTLENKGVPNSNIQTQNIVNSSVVENPKKKNNNILIIASLILIVIVGIILGFIFLKDKDANKDVVNTNQEEQKIICTSNTNQKYSRKEKTPGYYYSCEVSDGVYHNFYVLSENEDGTINLIMDRNICGDGTESTENNKCSVAWAEGDFTEQDVGPITALSTLYEATKNWNNVQDIMFNYSDENINSILEKGMGLGYKGIKTDKINKTTSILKEDDTASIVLGSIDSPLKARLPMMSELISLGCESYEKTGDLSYGSCKSWLVDNTTYTSSVKDITNINGISGYWTLSSNTQKSDSAWSVSASGIVSFATVRNGYDLGIRPVITLSKLSLS